MNHAALTDLERIRLARWGKFLEVFTIVWATTEAAVALGSAAHTGSVSLAGFGWDSLIEVFSAVAIWWRMTHELDHHRRHRAEHVSLRIAGGCLLALGLFVLLDSVRRLWLHEHASVDLWGILITMAAVVMMPALAWQKRRVGRALHSRAMTTDAQQTDFCMYQAGIVLLGIVCFRFFHVWWADSAAALVLVPILLRASWLTFQGEHCCAYH